MTVSAGASGGTASASLVEVGDDSISEVVGPGSVVVGAGGSWDSPATTSPARSDVPMSSTGSAAASSATMAADATRRRMGREEGSTEPAVCPTAAAASDQRLRGGAERSAEQWGRSPFVLGRAVLLVGVCRGGINRWR